MPTSYRRAVNVLRCDSKGWSVASICTTFCQVRRPFTTHAPLASTVRSSVYAWYMSVQSSCDRWITVPDVFPSFRTRHTFHLLLQCVSCPTWWAMLWNCWIFQRTTCPRPTGPPWTRTSKRKGNQRLLRRRRVRFVGSVKEEA